MRSGCRTSAPARSRRPAAGPLTAAITGQGIRLKSTIAWWRTSAPRRTSGTRSAPGSSRPRRNQLMSPPAEKARPSPVTIKARIGARSASQGAISGQLGDHLGAHRVHVVGPRRASGCRRVPPSRTASSSARAGSGDVTGSLMLTPRGRRALVRRECMAGPVPTVPGAMAATDDKRRNAAPRGHLRAAQAAARPARCLHVQRRRRAGSSTSASRARSASASPATSRPARRSAASPTRSSRSTSSSPGPRPRR